MTTTHFKSSSLGELQRVSQVEARYATVTGLEGRTGFSFGPAPTGRITISGYNKWVQETDEREKFLAKPIARAKEFVGPDYKPMIGSAKFGVNRSSHGPIYKKSTRGAPVRQIQPGDTVGLPDPRDSFGHNRDAQTRIPRVRGIS